MVYNLHHHPERSHILGAHRNFAHLGWRPNLLEEPINGQEIRLKRVAAKISGRLLCQRVALERSRLSDIERGYVQPSPDESARISKALDELIEAREKVARFARECGWPVTAL